MADIQVAFGFRSTGTLKGTHKKFSKTKSEESGYDSDTTRKSGSVKSDSFDPSETDSSTSEQTTSDCQLKQETISTEYLHVPQPTKPKMKKPPRKRKKSNLEELKLPVKQITLHSLIQTQTTILNCQNHQMLYR